MNAGLPNSCLKQSPARFCASVNGIALAGLRSVDIACNFGNCYNPKYQNVSASNLRVTMELGLIVLGCIRHLRIRGAEIRGGHSMTILT